MDSRATLKIFGHACTLLFWVGFFGLLLPGILEKSFGMGRTVIIGGAAILCYVVSFLIKRHLVKTGVPESELKHMAK